MLNLPSPLSPLEALQLRTAEFDAAILAAALGQQQLDAAIAAAAAPPWVFVVLSSNDR